MEELPKKRNTTKIKATAATPKRSQHGMIRAARLVTRLHAGIKFKKTANTVFVVFYVQNEHIVWIIYLLEKPCA